MVLFYEYMTMLGKISLMRQRAADCNYEALKA